MSIGYQVKNTASALAFRMSVQRLPNVVYMTQKVYIPGLFLPSTEQANPFVGVKQQGDHILYEEATINFVVDQDFKNWLEIYSWIRGQGFPDSNQEYTDLVKGDPAQGLGKWSSVTLLGEDQGSRKSVIEFELINAFPVSLSGVQFDTTIKSPEADQLNATVKFAYTQMDVRPV